MTKTPRVPARPPVKNRGGREPKDKGLPRMPADVIQKDLAAALGLTQRRVQQLLKEGVLVGDSRSSYPLADNIARYIDFKVKAAIEKAAPASGDKLRERREEQLAIRIGREERQLITLNEALETVDKVTGHFLQTISGLPARHTRDLTERKRLEATCDNVKQQLSDDFVKERDALRTGRPVGEADEEDDA